MRDEVVEALRPETSATLVDATLGAGGHAEALLERQPRDGRLFGIDTDPVALALACERLRSFGDRFVAIRGRYEDLPDLLREHGAFAVDGIVADLGISSMQVDDPERGFSFLHDGPLDMRMDPTAGPTAAEYLESVSEDELRRALRTWGEERRAGAIARAIVRARSRRPLQRTGELAALVEKAAGPAAARYRIHPATRTFQALRIAVNRELVGLADFVRDCAAMLRRGGRLAIVSFHSLEDRAVKQAVRELAHRCVCPPSMPVCGCGREDVLATVHAKALRPSAEEARRNPRSRSARMRVAERL
jgi:16S rRNA (cytosine1402-N4)-methyltransferase